MEAVVKMVVATVVEERLMNGLWMKIDECALVRSYLTPPTVGVRISAARATFTKNPKMTRMQLFFIYRESSPLVPSNGSPT